MKIAFPTQESSGIDSPVYTHFGSARFFVIVDPETGDMETKPNHDLNHMHGNCQPLAALGNSAVHAVVVGGIGLGALRKLSDAGIMVYQAVEGTVSDNLELITAGKLPKFSAEQTCAGHHAKGECAH